MFLGRLFIGGYREIRRPVHIVDETLMRRIEQARERLRIEGKEIRPVRELKATRTLPKPHPRVLRPERPAEPRRA